MGKSKRSPFYVDMGQRILQARLLANVTQQTLGNQIGVSLQTIQRYEAGEIGIPAEALGVFAKTLNTPVGFFYGEGGTQPTPANTNRLALTITSEIMAIPDDTIRKSIAGLVRAIGRYADNSENGDSAANRHANAPDADRS